MAYYGKYDRGDDPRYRPYHKQDEDSQEEFSSDNRLESRALSRQAKKNRYSVWARSPSPPQKKKVSVSLATSFLSSEKEINHKETSSKKESASSSYKLKNAYRSKSDKIKRKSGSSSSSSSGSSSSSSSSSDSNDSSSGDSDSSSSSDGAKRKRRSKPRMKKEPKRSISSVDNKVPAAVAVEPTKAEEIEVPNIEEALGFSEYDHEEAERFRRDVQGDRIRSGEGDSDEDDDFGPLPMVQPKDYAEDKKVRSRIAFLNNNWKKYIY